MVSSPVLSPVAVLGALQVLLASSVVSAASLHGISDGKGWTNNTLGWIDGCGLRRYTAADWRASGINAWLSGELTRFNAHARDDEEFARDYLIPIYASKAASQLTACYVDRHCDIIASCDDLNPNYDRQTQEYALNAIMAISTLNGHFGDILKATDVGAIASGIGMEALVEQFTFADEFDQYEDHVIYRKGMDLKSWMYMGGLINAFITEVKDIGSIADPVFKDKWAPYLTAVQDLWSLGYAGYLFDAALTPEGKDKNTDHELVATRDISSALVSSYIPARIGFLNSTRDIVKGWTLDNSTLNMASFLQDGLFTSPSLSQTVNTQAASTRAWYGMAIGQLYDTERVYMLQVNTRLGKTCAEDDRGPAWVKVCLPEHPTKVFYVYGIPKFEEHNNKRVTDVTAPPGWDSFRGKGFQGITQEDIVRSSKNYWDLYGNSRNQASMPSIFHSSMPSSGPGTFTIPICNDPHGNFISSTDSKEGRSFPCQCAAKDPVPGHEDKVAVNQRQAEFLVATHLRFSYDYNQQCLSLQNDRQGCTWYNDAHFDTNDYTNMGRQAITGANLGTFYPQDDWKIEINHKACFERKVPIDQVATQCEALVAFDSCRPGYYFGRTNIEGQQLQAIPPKIRGYGIGPSGD